MDRKWIQNVLKNKGYVPQAEREYKLPGVNGGEDVPISYETYKVVSSLDKSPSLTTRDKLAKLIEYKAIDPEEEKRITQWAQQMNSTLPYEEDLNETGDLAPSLWNTVGYTGERFLGGMIDAIEGATNFALGATGKIGSAVTSGFGAFKNPVSETLNQGANFYIGGGFNVGDKYDEWIEKKSLDSSATKQSTKKWVQPVAESAGAMAAAIALAPPEGFNSLSKAFSGAKGLKNAATLSENAGKIASGLNTVNAALKSFFTPSAVVFGAGAAGNAAKEAYKETGSTNRALAYGASSGLVEMATERLFGGFAGTDIGEAAIDFTVKNPIVRKSLNIASEGVEEIISDLVNPGLQRTILNKNAEMPTVKDLGVTAMNGILLSGIMSVAMHPVKARQTESVAKSLNDSVEALKIVMPEESYPAPLNVKKATVSQIEERQNVVKNLGEKYENKLDQLYTSTDIFINETERQIENFKNGIISEETVNDTSDTETKQTLSDFRQRQINFANQAESELNDVKTALYGGENIHAVTQRILNSTTIFPAYIAQNSNVGSVDRVNTNGSIISTKAATDENQEDTKAVTQYRKAAVAITNKAKYLIEKAVGGENVNVKTAGIETQNAKFISNPGAMIDSDYIMAHADAFADAISQKNSTAFQILKEQSSDIAMDIAKNAIYGVVPDIDSRAQRILQTYTNEFSNILKNTASSSYDAKLTLFQPTTLMSRQINAINKGDFREALSANTAQKATEEYYAEYQNGNTESLSDGTPVYRNEKGVLYAFGDGAYNLASIAGIRPSNVILDGAEVPVAAVDGTNIKTVQKTPVTQETTAVNSESVENMPPVTEETQTTTEETAEHTETETKSDVEKEQQTEPEAEKTEQKAVSEQDFTAENSESSAEAFLETETEAVEKSAESEETAKRQKHKPFSAADTNVGATISETKENQELKQDNKNATMDKNEEQKQSAGKTKIIRAKKGDWASHDVVWYAPNSKIVIAYSTVSASDLIDTLSSDNPNMTIAELQSVINYDAEAKKVLQAYIDSGFEDEIASKHFGTYANNSASTAENTAEAITGTADTSAPDNNAKITVDMSDAERAEILSRKNIKVVNFNTKRTDALKEYGLERLQKTFVNLASPIIKKVADDFGIVGKTYFNSDIELEFKYSKSSLKESAHKQGSMYGDFIKMLSVFPNVIENAVGVETHTDKYKGTVREDTRLKQMYVLASAFSDESGVIPVKLEVKEFKQDTNKLYMSVVLAKKESRVLDGNLGQNQLNTAPPTSTLSISDLVGIVNSSEGDFLKYFPDSMLDSEQIEGKNKALAADAGKIKALTTKEDSATKTADSVADRAEIANNVARLEQIESAVRKGESISLQKVRAAVESLLSDHGSSVKAEMSKLKNNDLKKRLNIYDRGRITKKADMVDAIYSDMLSSLYYALSGKDTMTYTYDGTGHEVQQEKMLSDVVDALTEKTFEAQLTDNAEKYKQQREAAEERLEKIKNPKTLKEYAYKKQYFGLSEEETIQYEHMYAEERKKARNEKKTSGETKTTETADAFLANPENYTIEKTKHTKNADQDVWVVKPVNRLETEEWKRLNEQMKKLGGSYWRGNQGWNFRHDPTSSFGATETAETAQGTTNAEKLRTVADNMQKTIDDKFRDRKTNTAKRASEAAAAEAEGERLQRIQTTLYNIAAALENGDSTLLDKIDSRAQVQTLMLVLNTGRRNRISETMEGITYDERVQEQSKPYTNEDVKYVEYPLTKLHENIVSGYLRAAEGKAGYKQASERLRKAIKSAKNGYVTIDSKLFDDIDKIVKNLAPFYEQTWNEGVAERKRLDRMGIKNVMELRAYLREFLDFLPANDVAAETQRAIRAKEIQLTNAKIEGFFPTPKPLVDRMVEEADIQPGETVIEPSAGKGNIADVIKEQYPDNPLDVVEWNASLNELLGEKGHNVVGTDFLQTSRTYDKIIMNPPFEKGQDIDHIRHAYSLLNDGGRLVCIMSEGPFFRNDKKSTDFREWLDEVGGVSEQLPEGTFKSSERSTGVNTRIVVIDKVANEKSTPSQKSAPEKSTSARSRSHKASNNDTESYYVPRNNASQKEKIRTAIDVVLSTEEERTLTRANNLYAKGDYAGSWKEAASTKDSNGKRKESILSVPEIVNNIAKRFNIPINQGNIRNPRAAGVYVKHAGTIRTRVANALPVISHELGHYLDEKYNLHSSDFLSEAKSVVETSFLDQYDTQTKPKEIVSEYIRVLMMDKNRAISAAPNFYKEFRDKLSKGKDMADFDAVAAMTNEYMAADFAARVDAATLSRKEADKLHRKEKSLLDKVGVARKLWIDEHDYMKRAVDYVRKVSGDDISGQKDAYLLAINSYNADSAASYLLTRGMADVNGNPIEGMSFLDCIQGVEDVKLLERYLILNHATEILAPKKGQPRMVFADQSISDPVLAEKEVRRIARQHPEIKRAADNIYKFLDKIRTNFLVEGGGISKELAEQLKEMYPHYVPFYRDVGSNGIGGKGSFANQSAPVRRMHGSGKAILSPLENIAIYVNQATRFAYRNKVAQQWADYAERYEGIGNLIEKVPPDKVPHTVDISEKKAKLTKALSNSLSENDMETVNELLDEILGDSVTGYDPIINSKKHIISVLQNGERVYYQINDPQLYESIAEMSPHTMNAFFKASATLMAPSKVLYTQYNPLFFLTNALRDYQTGYKNSERISRILYTVDYMKAFTHIIRSTPEYQQYLAAGGGYSSDLSATRDAMQRTLRQINAKNAGAARRIANAFLHPVRTASSVMDSIASVSDIVESIPRLAEFEYAKKHGADTQEAIYRAKDITTNFSKHGKYGRELNALVMYSNAAIQSVDKMFRMLGSGDPKKTLKYLYKLIFQEVLIGALIAWWNNWKDEEGSENLATYLKNGFYMFALGDGKFLKIAKPREYAAASSLTSAAIDYAFGNQNAFHEFGGYLMENFMPNFIPTDFSDPAVIFHDILGNTAIGPAVDIMSNMDFKHTPIVGEYMKNNVPKRLQYNDRTSMLAYWIGQTFNQSPMVIDHIISNSTGILGKVNRALFPMNAENRDLTMGLKSTFIADSAYSTDVLDIAYDDAQEKEDEYKVNPSAENGLLYEKSARRTAYITKMNKLINALPYDERRSARLEMLEKVKDWDMELSSTEESIVSAIGDSTEDMSFVSASIPEPELTIKTAEGNIKETLSIDEYEKYVNDYLKQTDEARKLVVSSGALRNKKPSEKSDLIKEAQSKASSSVRDMHEMKKIYALDGVSNTGNIDTVYNTNMKNEIKYLCDSSIENRIALERSTCTESFLQKANDLILSYENTDRKKARQYLIQNIGKIPIAPTNLDGSVVKAFPSDASGEIGFFSKSAPSPKLERTKKGVKQTYTLSVPEYYAFFMEYLKTRDSARSMTIRSSDFKRSKTEQKSELLEKAQSNAASYVREKYKDRYMK